MKSMVKNKINQINILANKIAPNSTVVRQGILVVAKNPAFRQNMIGTYKH